MNRAQIFLYRYTRALVRLFLSKASQWNVAGIEYIPNGEPLIIVMNHVNRLDGMVVMAAFPDIVSPIVAYDIISGSRFLSTVVHYVAVAFGSVVIDRHNGIKVSAIKYAKKKLEDGYSLLIAPEGTRSSEDGLGAFQDGAAYLAAMTGARVLPVVTFGYGGKTVLAFLRSRSIHVVFDEPISPRSESNRNTIGRQGETLRIRERIRHILFANAVLEDKHLSPDAHC